VNIGWKLFVRYPGSDIIISDPPFGAKFVKIVNPGAHPVRVSAFSHVSLDDAVNRASILAMIVDRHSEEKP
jgi:hypothetical protein